MSTDAAFYVFDVGERLATLSRSEVESADSRVHLHISITGDVRVE